MSKSEAERVVIVSLSTGLPRYSPTRRADCLIIACSSTLRTNLPLPNAAFYLTGIIYARVRQIEGINRCDFAKNVPDFLRFFRDMRGYMTFWNI